MPDNFKRHQNDWVSRCVTLCQQALSTKHVRTREERLKRAFMVLRKAVSRTNRGKRFIQAVIENAERTTNP